MQPQPLIDRYDYSDIINTSINNMITNSNFEDHPIAGHGLMAVREMPHEDVRGISEDQLKKMVKEDLVHRLIEKAQELKLIEYTKFHDIFTDRVTIRARCYLLPDDKVRLLRVNKLIK